MNKPLKFILIALGVLALGVLACGQIVTPAAPNALGTPTPNALGTETATVTALPTGTPPPFPYEAEVTEPLTVRDGAGEEFNALGYLDPGDSVMVYNLVKSADGGKWASVDGGYVNAKYLSKK